MNRDAILCLAGRFQALGRVRSFHANGGKYRMDIDCFFEPGLVEVIADTVLIPPDGDQPTMTLTFAAKSLRAGDVLHLEGEL